MLTRVVSSGLILGIASGGRQLIIGLRDLFLDLGDPILRLGESTGGLSGPVDLTAEPLVLW